MRVLAYIVLLLSVPSASADWQSMDCAGAPVVTASTITWVRTDDPAATCAALGASTLPRGGACISCSPVVAGKTTCTLYAEAPAALDDAFLGHEVKHAFGCKHGKYF